MRCESFCPRRGTLFSRICFTVAVEASEGQSCFVEFFQTPFPRLFHQDFGRLFLWRLAQLSWKRFCTGFKHLYDGQEGVLNHTRPLVFVPVPAREFVKNFVLSLGWIIVYCKAKILFLFDHEAHCNVNSVEVQVVVASITNLNSDRLNLAFVYRLPLEA